MLVHRSSRLESAAWTLWPEEVSLRPQRDPPAPSLRRCIGRSSSYVAGWSVSACLSGDGRSSPRLGSLHRRSYSAGPAKRQHRRDRHGCRRRRDRNRRRRSGSFRPWAPRRRGAGRRPTWLSPVRPAARHQVGPCGIRCRHRLLPRPAACALPAARAAPTRRRDSADRNALASVADKFRRCGRLGGRRRTIGDTRGRWRGRLLPRRTERGPAASARVSPVPCTPASKAAAGTRRADSRRSRRADAGCAAPAPSPNARAIASAGAFGKARMPSRISSKVLNAEAPPR